MGPALIPLAIVATIGSTAVAVYSAHEQGVVASTAAKQKARVEADKATQQQITMRQNMLRALSSQNAASLGAVGTGGATSFGANARRQINQAQNDIMVSRANSSAQVSLLDQQARNDVAAGNLAAVGDALGGAAKVAELGAPS